MSSRPHEGTPRNGTWIASIVPNFFENLISFWQVLAHAVCFGSRRLPDQTLADDMCSILHTYLNSRIE